MAQSTAGQSGVRANDEVHEPIGSLHEALQTPCRESEAVVEGLIERGQIVVLGARSGTGKTPLKTQVASCVAAGEPFLGMPTRRCRVAIIDLESDASCHRLLLQRQWAALGLDPVVVGQQIDVFVRGNPDDPNSRELDRILNELPAARWRWLSHVARDRQYGLIIVDTALAFTSFKASDEAQTRALFGLVSKLRRTPPYPAIGFTIHLRKADRKVQGPSLLVDPRAWTDEFLGSVVWSASADVRLGMEALGKDGQVVFSGFRRGEGDLSPRIIEPTLEDFDGVMQATSWALVDPTVAAGSVLSPGQQTCFRKLPVGQDLTWAQFLAITGAAKSSASRLIARLVAVGLLERDTVKKTFRRKV